MNELLFGSDLDRRAFLRTAGSAALLAALGISLSACDSADPAAPGNDTNLPADAITISGNTITLNLLTQALGYLREPGTFVLIRQAQTLAVNVDGTLIRAFSSVCPHAGCSDLWEYTNNRLRCTCHNSIFENTGARVSGPATQNLREFQVRRDGNTVVITRTT